jgi:hypothetical protein
LLAVVVAVVAGGPAYGAGWFLEGPELAFVHEDGATGRLSLPEMMGGGVGFADLDNDGRLDVILVDSGGLDPGGPPRRDALLRNLGLDSKGQPRFEPFPPLAPGRGYGMGVATGDIDDDGDIDLVLTGLFGDQLLRNRGDGRFEDVSARAGLDGKSDWSTAAVLADLDGDGDLDLWLGRYVGFERGREPKCYAPSSRLDYCGPAAFAPASDVLMLNRGDGTFVDASEGWGLARVKAPGLGGVVLDAGQGAPLSLYVANDGAPNHLWTRGQVDDGAVMAGVAVNVGGRPEAGMGVVAADLDGDLDEDLVITHLAQETHTVYINQGDGFFLDRTAISGIGPASLAQTGFGICALDANLDRIPDLVVANGAVRLVEARVAAGLPPLAERPQLFLGLGDGRFRLATVEEAGPFFAEEIVGRGLACGDVDGDGDTDVLIGVNGDRPRLLLGQARERGGRSLGVLVKRRSGGPDELGAAVTLVTDQGARMGRIRTDGSYLAAHEPKLIFALGPGERPISLEVSMSDGTRETFGLEPGVESVVVVRGTGKAKR